MTETQAAPAPSPLEPNLRLVLPGRRDSVAGSMTWIADGWKLFVRAPLMWIISVVLMFLMMMGLGLVPFLGSIATAVLQAELQAGYAWACRSLETGGDFDLEHLFAGFAKRFGPLAVVGLVLFAAVFVIALVVFLVLFGAIVGAGIGQLSEPETILKLVMESALLILVGVLVFLALLLPIVAAYWFAPNLVMLNGMGAMAAMKASFFACFRNILPFLVYGLVMLVLLLIAMIPFGLGLLVWIPLAISSTYVAYRRIFTDDLAPQPSATVA